MTEQRTTTPDRIPDPPLAPRAMLRWDVVDRILRTIEPSSVLEIGCGIGGFGARIARRADYLAVEPDATSYARARENIEPRGGTVINGTDAAVPAGRQFDLVCAFEVLEHIEDDAAALQAWVRHVRPGGWIMLSVPAFQERFGPMDTMAGHFRRYSPDEISGALEQAGFVQPNVIVYAWPLGYALEAVRNRQDTKRIAELGEDASIEALTAASGRTQQPRRRLVGGIIGAGTLPFRYLQRLRNDRGTGIVAVARAPHV